MSINTFYLIYQKLLLTHKMKKKLKPSGNGWEFYFSKPLLKILGYNPQETKLLITSSNGTLRLEPISKNEIEKYAHNLVKNFQKSGGSHGIYFSQELIEILDINPNIDFIDVQIDNNVIIMKKA